MTPRPYRSLPRLACLAGEAAVALTLAHALTRLLRPPRLMRVLGRAGPASVAPPAATPAPAAARRVAHAVDRVADALPWRLVCLPRAVATRVMLRRRRIPCELHLGIATTAPLSAHAWVTVGGAVVQGGPVRHVTPLATLR